MKRFKINIFQTFLVQNRLKSCQAWRYRLWSFKTRDTKLERFLDKTQRKLLNCENWTKVIFFGMCSKMQIIPIKNLNIKKVVPQFLWFFRLKC